MTGRIQLFLKKFVQTALAHVESTRQILHADFFQKMLIQIADDLVGLIGFNLNKFVGIFQGIVNDFYQKTGGCTTGIGFGKLPIRSIFPVKGFKFFLKISKFFFDNQFKQAHKGVSVLISGKMVYLNFNEIIF